MSVEATGNVIPAMLYLAAAEGMVPDTVEQIKDAHSRRFRGSSYEERLKADMEWGRLGNDLKILNDTVVPNMRSWLAQQVVSSDELTDIEKAVYTHAVTAPERRKEIDAELLLPLNDLNAAAIEDSPVYLDRIGALGDGQPRFLGRIAQSGVSVRFNDPNQATRSARVGLMVTGAKLYPSSRYDSFGRIELLPEPTFAEITNLVNRGGHYLPSLGNDGDSFSIGQEEYEKRIAEGRESDKRLVEMASLLTGIALGEEVSLESEYTEQIKQDLLDAIEQQARGRCTSDNATEVRLGNVRSHIPAEKKVIEDRDYSPELARKLIDLSGLKRHELEQRLAERISSEKAAILDGATTGENWSELQLADAKLPGLLNRVFGEV